MDSTSDSLDDDKKKIHGRTKLGWIQIFSFFIIFYFTLAAWYMSLMCFFNSLVDPFVPSLNGKKAFIKNPGMGFRPRVGIKSTRIEFDDNPKSKRNWALIQNLNDTLQDYRNNNTKPFLKTVCTDEDRATAAYGCVFPDREYYSPMLEGKCHGYGDEYFGYTKDKDYKCVMVRLNKIFGWEPEAYKLEDLEKDSSVPEKVKIYARSRPDSPRWASEPYKNLIFLWCTTSPELPTDYLPLQGFPHAVYQYRNQFGYQQPYVMVVFRDVPKRTKVRVQCRVWAPNIRVDTETKEGAVDFELYYR